MNTFSVLPVAGSGLHVDQTWIDTIGGNVANAHDVATPGRPLYRPQYVQATPAANGGVRVGAITLGSARGVLAYDPTNPVANAAGYVAHPAVSMGTEMVGLVTAQAAYTANAAVVRHADAAYKSILNMGA
ncbi:MAG: flagellar basal body rod protein FlgC [Acidimicrobiales bacterium]